jgi:hypothetical protein
MTATQLLTIRHMIHLYWCTYPVALALQRTTQDGWEDCLPLFAAPAQTPEAITTILEQACSVRRFSGESAPVDVEEMLSGVRSRWQITFFSNGAVRISPSAPAILNGEGGEYRSWRPMQGQSFLESPYAFAKITARILEAVALFHPA